MQSIGGKCLILTDTMKFFSRVCHPFNFLCDIFLRSYSYDFGFGKKMVYSSLAINDGHWHKIMINK